MAVKVILKEEKKQVNEVLGTLIAYGLLLGLLAKIFKFKFKFSNNDDVRNWSVSLGDAFEYTSSKIKKAGLSTEDTQQCNQIVENAKTAINDVIRQEEERIRRGAASTSTATLDGQIETIYNKMLSDLTRVIKDPRKAEIFAGPKRNFASLSLGLRTLRIDSLRGFLTSPSGRSRIRSIIATHSGVAPTSVTDAQIDAVIATFPTT